MTQRVESILDTMASKHLFAKWFKDAGTWQAWRAFLAALFALDMTPEQLTIYRQCTGRDKPPMQPFSEGWLIVGRRGGKSFILSLVAVYLSCFKNWQPFLSPGETGVVMILARDRSQARVIFNYLKALLTEVPVLAQYVLNITRDRIELVGSVCIEVHTASYGAIRGRTCIVGLCDELAFWNVEGANPDTEILRALRPSMATVPQSVLLCASSPYAKRGSLYRAWRDHFGKDSPTLVWQADTKRMNPTIAEALIAKAYEDDPSSAAAEYGAEFRSDIESFIAREAAEACVIEGRRELPPLRGIHYKAFVDPSGGSSDSMTLAIAHLEKERIVIDAVRERKPPFSPESVVDEFASLLKAFRVLSVVGDRYAGEWPRERFKRAGIQYLPSAAPKSDLYRDMLPTLNSGQVELLDLPKLVNQICSLERRTARGGRDSIDHPPGQHDDLANVLAGVAGLCRKPPHHGPRVSRLGEGPRQDGRGRGPSEGARPFGGGSFGGFLRNG